MRKGQSGDTLYVVASGEIDIIDGTIDGSSEESWAFGFKALTQESE